ncbi:unnamed protein product [Tilletia laevis]|nr:unnamed protein product [Tilletia laevis]
MPRHPPPSSQTTPTQATTSSSFVSDDAGPSRTASTSKVTLGPALPPGLSAGSKAAGNNYGDSDDDDIYLIGPAPPPGGAEAESTAEPLGNSTRAFIEREERRRKAQEITRVQTRGSAPTGPADPESMAASTETPEQRMQHALRDEVEGRRPKLREEKINQDGILRADAQRRKDEEIARRIKSTSVQHSEY